MTSNERGIKAGSSNNTYDTDSPDDIADSVVAQQQRQRRAALAARNEDNDEDDDQ